MTCRVECLRRPKNLMGATSRPPLFSMLGPWSAGKVSFQCPTCPRPSSRVLTELLYFLQPFCYKYPRCLHFTEEEAGWLILGPSSRTLGLDSGRVRGHPRSSCCPCPPLSCAGERVVRAPTGACLVLGKFQESEASLRFGRVVKNVLTHLGNQNGSPTHLTCPCSFPNCVVFLSRPRLDLWIRFP